MSLKDQKIRLTLASLVILCSLLVQQPAYATLFGQGKFGVSTFGSLSSLSIAFTGGANSDGNVAVPLSPNGGNFTGNGSANVVVTTNDGVGYRLYVLAPISTNLTRTGSSDTIATSGNSTPAALAVNTWGFNTSGSTTNFQGVLSTPTEIKVASGPFTSGDTTTVTYGVTTDITKPAGSYVGNVVYTAVNRFGS